jgi:integrase
MKTHKSKATFILDRPNNPTETYILLSFVCKDKKLKYSTGLKVLPSAWDKSGGKKFHWVKRNQKFNLQLKSLYDLVEGYFKPLDDRKTVLSSDLKQYLDSATKEPQATLEQGHTINRNFFEILKGLIDRADPDLNQYIPIEKKILCKKNEWDIGKEYSTGTVKSWRSTRNVLFNFQPEMTFENITMQTYYDFIEWCKVQKNNKGEYFTHNYIGALIKEWKTLLRISNEDGQHSNLIFHAFKKIVTEDRFTKQHKKYLNNNDIIKLLDIKLEGIEEEIRDRYIINLFTGMRISDMKTLTIDQFDFEGETIDHYASKNGKSISVQIHDEIKTIVEKYNGDLPKQHHETIVNRYIKLIAKKAKINEKVTVEEMRGGKHVKTEVPKWKLITNHTARRSMVTNSLLNNVNPMDLESMVGMTTKTMENYNEATAKEKAKKYKDHPNFKSLRLQIA